MKFLVYPGPDDGLYWTVCVYQREEAMQQAARRLHDPKIKLDFEAICLPQVRTRVKKNGETVEKPSMGYVLFCRRFFTPEHIAHEAVHMVMEYLRRMNVKLNFGKHNDELEEALAYPVGRCVRQIIQQSDL